MQILSPAPGMVRAEERARHERCALLLKEKFNAAWASIVLDLGDVVATVERSHFLDFVKLLKLDSQLQFNMLLSVTAVDWLDAREQRFEAVYHFLSIEHGFRVRVKVALPEHDPVIDSLTALYAGADFMERETWDMVGISFRGHPDQRRILMYDEFVGHPLRKDYPVQGKQPRIPLRAPEVENTARAMIRPPLFSINKRQKEKGEGAKPGQSPAHR